MACNKCWLEDPKLSKFCRYCGQALGIRLRCPQCSSENTGDALFCIVCGARLLKIKKPVKGTQRKCGICGHFNELDAAYCVICGEEIIREAKENLERRSSGPSFKTIGLLIGAVFFIGVLIKAGTTLFQAGSNSVLSSSPALFSKSMDVDEAEVIAVAKNFKCACGKCGELPLATL